MSARLRDDLAEIAVILAQAQHRARAAEIPTLDDHLRHARDYVVSAARRTGNLRRRPDGSLWAAWAVAEVVALGVVAFAGAHVGGVVFELRDWLTALVVMAAVFALSFAAIPAARRLDALATSAALPASWPGEQSAIADQEVGALLNRARGLIGRLAVERLDRVRAAKRTGPVAEWAGRHDALLLHLHHADAHLCAARYAWTVSGGAR